MKITVLVLLSIFSMKTFAEWTAEPTESAVVWSFDHECVDLKLKDGKMLRVQKKVLGNRKLEAHKTTIEFHKGALDKDLCK